MNLNTLIEKYAAALKSAGIENFQNEARWLVLETLALPASALFGDFEPSDAQMELLEKQLSRRCRREPLQYILGNAPFGELDLKVTPAVLIPRCETEILVDYAVKHLPAGGTLLDVGCGSGAIGLLAAYRRRDIAVTALDKSPEALRVAGENARLLELDCRVTFKESDLLSVLTEEKFDLIAANLPYVTFAEYADLAPEVRSFEPQSALTAPEEGMALIFELIRTAPSFLIPGDRIVLEMSPHQTARAEAALEASAFGDVEIFADQFGKMRFVAAQYR